MSFFEGFDFAAAAFDQNDILFTCNAAALAFISPPGCRGHNFVLLVSTALELYGTAAALLMVYR